MVLDRPNPIGGVEVEGGGIDNGLESFVGFYPVPQRHGMTVGELARLYNTTFDIGCELEVVSCEGWYRHELFDKTELPWVMPSAPSKVSSQSPKDRFEVRITEPCS